jgi:hypothetical protein
MAEMAAEKAGQYVYFCSAGVYMKPQQVVVLN